MLSMQRWARHWWGSISVDSEELENQPFTLLKVKPMVAAFTGSPVQHTKPLSYMPSRTPPEFNTWLTRSHSGFAFRSSSHSGFAFRSSSHSGFAFKSSSHSGFAFRSSTCMWASLRWTKTATELGYNHKLPKLKILKFCQWQWPTA